MVLSFLIFSVLFVTLESHQLAMNNGAANYMVLVALYYIDIKLIQVGSVKFCLYESKIG